MKHILQDFIDDAKTYVNEALMFPIWYFVYSLRFWYKFCGNSMITVYDVLGVGPVLSHLFAPFRHDRTFAGYLIGITIRVFWMGFSSLTLAIIFIVFFALVAFYYLAPLIIYLEMGSTFVLYYFIGWLLYYIYHLTRDHYWKGIQTGNLTRSLAHEVWVRLELNPVEADNIYIQGKQDFIEYLKKHELNEESYLFVKQWLLEKEYRKQAWKFWRDEFYVRRKGVNVGWISGFLPEVKRFSTDLTDRASSGHLPHIYGREREIDKIIEVLRRPSKNNILIVGEAGVGKTSMVYALAWMIIGQRSRVKIEGLNELIKPLEGKRVIELHVGGMVGGTAARGALEQRLNTVLRELQQGDTILFINQIENLVEAGLIAYITPLLSSTRFPIIATTTPQVYRESLSKMTEFITEIETLVIKPPSVGETINILKGVAGSMESKYNVLFTYPALRSATELSERYIHNLVLPDKAVKVLMKAAEVRTTRVIGKKGIEAVVSEMSSVPVGDLSNEETDKLLNLENLLKSQIIGQEQGVREIARAIRRARTGVGSKERPIASLLFTGPTGVGKTLTAKSLAQVYFTPQSNSVTSEVELSQLVQNNFIRFDMSEFSEYGSVDKFIDRITKDVSSKPFALLLLDEFEKAEDAIHNLFLQIFEDGRLSNEDGQVVDFRNTIIIATSNAVQAVPDGITDEDRYMHDELEKFFRPELVNRFDGVVLFRKLEEKHILRVVVLELENLKKRLKSTYEIELSWNDQLVAELAKLGYDPVYGARPLKRVIQNQIEDQLAQRILKKELQAGDNFELSVALLQG